MGKFAETGALHRAECVRAFRARVFDEVCRLDNDPNSCAIVERTIAYVPGIEVRANEHDLLGGHSTANFTDQPKVANGASELMVAAFGEAGKHARSAVGVPVLPLGAAVEVDAIFALRTA